MYRGVTSQPESRKSLLSTAEVAARLGVSRTWVYRHAYKLGGIRLGGLLRFDPSDVDAFLVAEKEKIRTESL